jgi:hypothetical protein
MKQFVVHENLLTYYSNFFRAALKGGFKEAREKTVSLEDQSPWLFEVFVHWLYYQRFPDEAYNDDQEIIKLFHNDNYVTTMYPGSNTLINLHVFADKYDEEKLRKATLDELYRRVFETDVGVYVSPHLINHAFEHLSTTTPMCRLLVDITCFLDMKRKMLPVNPGYITSLPFLKLVWQKYREAEGVSSGIKFSDFNLCDYHEHNDMEERKVCEEETAKFKERVKKQK